MRLISRLTRSLQFIALGIAMAWASPAMAQDALREGEKINWLTYMQHAASASAIAMALSYVDQCSKKLIISELETKDLETGNDIMVLSFSCQGNEDEEGTALLEFFGNREAIESGGPHLKSFDFAG